MLSYLILSHISAQNVLDLIAQVYRPNDIYLVHMDAKAPAAEHRKLSQLSQRFGNILVAKPSVCSWGSWSLVKTTLLGLKILIQNPKWSHCILLSEQHYALKSGDEIAASLRDHVSFVEGHHVEQFYEGGRADIYHRFNRFYSELQGVGSFGARVRAPHGVRIHHGSQWMILSLWACMALCKKSLYGWQPFSSSLLPDETAIQSILLTSEEADRGVVVNECKTFVAWPHLTDNNDLIASAATHRAALASNAFFVRKRPADLTPVRGDWPLKLQYEFVDADAGADVLAIKRDELTRQLNDLLLPKGFHVIDMRGDFLYLQVRRAEWRDELFICICTYNLVEAAVCAVLKRKTYDLIDFQNENVSVHVLKVRAFDLFLSAQLSFDDKGPLVKLGEQPAATIVERVDEVAKQLGQFFNERLVDIANGRGV